MYSASTPELTTPVLRIKH